MFRSGSSFHVTGKRLAPWALLALPLLFLKGCIYEPVMLPRNCCEAGIELDILLAEQARDVVIVWSGELESVHPPPVGTDLPTGVHHWSRSFNMECQDVRVDGLIATCPLQDPEAVDPEDRKPAYRLRAGAWSLTISAYRDDGLGNLTPITGSPFACQIDVPTMLDAEGRRQPERRTKLRLIEGTETRNGCYPTVMPRRTEKVPVALYDFEEGAGDTIVNRMGDSALDLTRQRGPALVWGDGFVSLSGATLVATDGPAAALTTALQVRNELTVEAWIRPAETAPTQADGSLARIVSLSANIAERNFTLGQQDSHYRMRVRRNPNPPVGDPDPPNGMPAAETSAESAATQFTHVVATYDETETIRVYINGGEAVALPAPGNFSGWDAAFRLALGDEVTGATRAWLGEYHMVAIYAEALSPREIETHSLVGPYAD